MQPFGPVGTYDITRLPPGQSKLTRITPTASMRDRRLIAVVGPWMVMRLLMLALAMVGPLLVSDCVTDGGSRVRLNPVEPEPAVIQKQSTSAIPFASARKMVKALVCE